MNNIRSPLIISEKKYEQSENEEQEDQSEKSIGYIGSYALITNNLTGLCHYITLKLICIGPAMLGFPCLFQKSGDYNIRL